jgi:integrase
MPQGHLYRRARTDGSLGRWNAVIDLPRAIGGPRRQVTRTFDTRREAQRWLAETATGVAGTAGTILGLLVRDWATTWLDQRSDLRPSTRVTCQIHLDRHVGPLLGDRPVRALSPAEIDGFVRSLTGSGLAPATVQRVVATLRSCLSAAVRAGILTSNPAVGVRMPTAPARLATVWTTEQCAHFLTTSADDGLSVLLRLALLTGMRRGELLGLAWADVDLPGASLDVRSTRVTVGRDTLTGPPKSRHGVRRVYLDATTVVALRRWQAAQDLACGTAPELVGTDLCGVPLSPSGVSREFARRAAAIGLPPIRFHDLRHTSATLGLASGESLKEVSMRLGHADIAITANVYAAVLPQAARASAARLGAALQGRAGRRDLPAAS